MQEVTNDYNYSELTKRVDELAAKLDVLNQTAMAMLVQMSRLYDVIAAEAFEKNDNISGLLTMHEQGDIYTTAPVLRSFGEPEDSPLKEEPEEEKYEKPSTEN